MQEIDSPRIRSELFTSWKSAKDESSMLCSSFFLMWNTRSSRCSRRNYNERNYFVVVVVVVGHIYFLRAKSNLLCSKSSVTLLFEKCFLNVFKIFLKFNTSVYLQNIFRISLCVTRPLAINSFAIENVRRLKHINFFQINYYV